jgi:hypothetical protein
LSQHPLGLPPHVRTGISQEPVTNLSVTIRAILARLLLTGLSLRLTLLHIFETL